MAQGKPNAYGEYEVLSEAPKDWLEERARDLKARIAAGHNHARFRRELDEVEAELAKRT